MIKYIFVYFLVMNFTNYISHHALCSWQDVAVPAAHLKKTTNTLTYIFKNIKQPDDKTLLSF